MRGEPLDVVAREANVSVAKLTEWRERALAGAASALKERERDDREDEIARLKSKVGEITMDNELLCAKIAAMEAKSPLGSRQDWRHGLGRVIERRQPGRANLPNSVEIIDPDWRAWIELRRQGADLDRGFEPPQRERGGLRKISPADLNTYRPPSLIKESVATEPRPAQRELPAWFADFRASLPP